MSLVLEEILDEEKHDEGVQDKVELNKEGVQDKVEHDEVEHEEGGQDKVELNEEGYYWRIRYFKLFYHDKCEGRFTGKKPKQAAGKAFSSIMKKLNGDGELNICFSIKECTRNSGRKEYKYIGRRIALEKPVDMYVPYWQNLTLEELKNKINICNEKSVSNISVNERGKHNLHSGKELSTSDGSTYFLSDNGTVFKKISYLFINKIDKQKRTIEDVQ